MSINDGRPGPMLAHRAPVRIALWGPPGSGKTTYLAALKVAVARYAHEPKWIMNGADEDAGNWLLEMMELLVEKRSFPPATIRSAAMTFQFNGQVLVDAEVTGGTGRNWLARWTPVARKPEQVLRPASFDLEVFDPPGGLYQYVPNTPQASPLVGMDDDEPEATPDIRQEQEEQLLEHLQECQGILFLFDPVRDARYADAFQYFYTMLEKLTRRWFARPQQQHVKLPHHLAVCITKFDDPTIYRKARQYGITEPGLQAPFLPEVPDQYAEVFFRQLCHESRGNADLVMNSIDAHLDASRVKYFVTSSIGLYVGPDRRFRPHDPVNVEVRADDTLGIRGRVYPMNLFEPLLWLEECLRNPR